MQNTQHQVTTEGFEPSTFRLLVPVKRIWPLSHMLRFALITLWKLYDSSWTLSFLILNCYCLIWPRTNYNTDYMGFFYFHILVLFFFIYLTIQGIITFKSVYFRTKYSAKRIIEFEFWFSLWCLINKAWSKYRNESLDNISETQSFS